MVWSLNWLNISYFVDTWENWDDLKWPTHKVCFLSAPVGKVPCPKHVLIKWTRYSFCLSLKVGFSSLPACRITQTSQLHVLAGTKGHLNLLVLQSLSLTALVIHFFPSAAPLASGMVCNVLFPGCWVYVTNKPLLIPSAQYWELCVWRPLINVGQEFTTGVNRRWSKTSRWRE